MRIISAPHTLIITTKRFKGIRGAVLNCSVSFCFNDRVGHTPVVSGGAESFTFSDNCLITAMTDIRTPYTGLTAAGSAARVILITDRTILTDHAILCTTITMRGTCCRTRTAGLSPISVIATIGNGSGVTGGSVSDSSTLTMNSIGAGTGTVSIPGYISSVATILIFNTRSSNRSTQNKISVITGESGSSGIARSTISNRRGIKTMTCCRKVGRTSVGSNCPFYIVFCLAILICCNHSTLHRRPTVTLLKGTTSLSCSVPSCNIVWSSAGFTSSVDFPPMIDGIRMTPLIIPGAGCTDTSAATIVILITDRTILAVSAACGKISPTTIIMTGTDGFTGAVHTTSS